MNHTDKCICSLRLAPLTRAGSHPAWIDSRSIFAGRDEVLIRHGDQTYRLRLTRFGKLILTK